MKQRLSSWWTARRTRTKALIVGAGVFTVFAIGASAGSNPETAVSPSPSPAATVEVSTTPDPTAAAATPEPTVSESPVTTADVETALAQLAFAEFVMEGREGALMVVSNLNDAATAFGEGDFVGARNALSNVRDTVRDQLEWLDQNPPHECYENFHTSLRSAYEGYDDGLTAGIRYLDEFPAADEEDLTTFQTQMQVGNALIGDLTNRMNDSDTLTVCSG